MHDPTTPPPDLAALPGTEAVAAASLVVAAVAAISLATAPVILAVVAGLAALAALPFLAAAAVVRVGAAMASVERSTSETAPADGDYDPGDASAPDPDLASD